MRASHLVLLLALAASACATRPRLPTTTTNAALERYAQGEDFDDIARDLGLHDGHSARDAVHDALRAMWLRYYREH